MPPGYGYIAGSTNRGATSAPGEKVIWTYSGALANGQALRTYLSGFDFYNVSPTIDQKSLGGGSYTMGVYQVYSSYEKYGMIYISSYAAYVAGSGSQTPAGSIQANVFIIGDR